jgi:GNAT superfamily N-acetyltransferase
VTVRPAALPDEVDSVVELLLGSVRWHVEQWPADFGPGSSPSGESGVPPLRDQLLEMAADRSASVLVAEHDGSVIGVLTGGVAEKPKGGMSRYDGPVAFVADLAVAPTHQRRGIGAQLMSSFESWARSRGAAHLRLFVHDGNTAAESLYERAGFRRVHVELRKDLSR